MSPVLPRPFPGFSPGALRFLRQLKRHNTRDWFVERKEEFDALVLEPMRLFVEEMDVRLARFAPEITGSPKTSIFRIYRDVRFSSDKSPYKTHVACWFPHRRGARGVGTETHGAGAGYYFHLEPGASLVAGGIWMPARGALERLRSALAADPDALRRVVRARPFRARFGGVSEERMLARIPRGYAADHPAGDLLRRVSFTASAPLADAEVTSASLATMVERDFRRLLPLVRWANEALGLPADTHRHPPLSACPPLRGRG